MRENETNPVIRIETHHHHMTFETETMELLGKPRHLEFLWNDEEKVLCVVIAEKHTRYSTTLPVPRKYVLVNRSGAVNVFDTYIKNMSPEHKARLEGSINSVILE